MTTKEALDELLLNTDYLFEEVEQHEKFADQETGEYQIYAYEKNKKELEAYLVVASALDPEIKTLEDIKKRLEELKEERGYEDEGEPSELETKFYDLLNPWYQKQVEANGGYGTQFEDLTEEEQKELAKINMEEGTKRVVMDDDPDECGDPCEDDVFFFYPYRGRISVVYNDYADCDFSSFSEGFQEKAYELVKKHLEGKN